MSGYNDFVRNAVTNYCFNTSKDIAFRYLYEKADIESAVRDHDYLDVRFTEYWVSKNSAADIEIQTRFQNRSRKWFNKRRWRLTASRFGEITKITTQRNKEKLCESLLRKTRLTKPIAQWERYSYTNVITRLGKDFAPRESDEKPKSGLFLSDPQIGVKMRQNGIMGTRLEEEAL
ncbi:hypothetical protein KUTeg_005705 [Tegillarca granosa]|uniref:Uncharacterized protein n=1 Tax=Tegillarca granosa TaxID=220873 RepID=A0ABQ9FHK7_TEGGR|nr:hypothetical protein KUTeg_005705 [Tegillarca granosa]